MKTRSTIYLIISFLIIAVGMACRVGDLVQNRWLKESNEVAIAVPNEVVVATPTTMATSTLFPTVTLVATIKPSPTSSRTPTKKPTLRPSPTPSVMPAVTKSPWPFNLKSRTESDAQGTFQIRARVLDENGVPINAYQIKLTGTGLDSPTIRYTGILEPEGEVGFSPMGGYVCPEQFNGLYFVTIYSEDENGNKQLSGNREIEFKGCSGGRGKIFLLFTK